MAESLSQVPDAFPAPRADAAAVGASPRPYRRHHWLVRVTHWAAFVLIAGMVASGLQIYRAYPRFGERGARLLPNPLNDAAIPLWARLGGWLAGGLNWHFFLMWPLMLVGGLYVGYLMGTGEWRKLVFRPRDVRPALEMQLYYLRLRKEHPPQGKHNGLQKAAYTFILLLGAASLVTGFAIWKPVELSWLTRALGGYQTARWLHFWAVWLFVGFLVVHVAAVFLADPAALRAMITGGYRGRYTNDEP